MNFENIGKWKIFALESGHFKLDGGAMMGSVPKVLWEKTNKPDGLNRIDLFIPEKTSRKLLENVPSSTKKYLRSNFLTKNNFDSS